MMMSLQCSPFPNCQRLMFKPLPQTPFIFRSHEAIHEPITKPRSRRRQRLLIASAAPEALVADPPPPTDESTSSPAQPPIVTPEAEKPGGKVKGTTEKPRLVLKFIWMEKNIGVGLDQLIPAHGTVPLSPYYFWPRKDAWEELKLCMESKPWISQKTMIILLNQATDIINLWQQSGGNLSSQ